MKVLYSSTTSSSSGCWDLIEVWDFYLLSDVDRFFHLSKSKGLRDLRAIGVPLAWSFSKFTWYKNKALYTRIATYSDQARPDLTFVSTSWRLPWDPTLGITLIRMSAMANATPIVTTVTKTTNKEKAPDPAPRVNILDFCEEHYEDILPIIMEKARRDKQKEVQTRLNFGENSKKTRRERENSNSRAENSPTRFHPERSRTRGRERRDDRNVFSRLSHRRKSVHERLIGNVPEWKIAPGALKNRMAILILRGPKPSIEIDLVTKIDPAT
ncbi:hypothetical protein Tco_0748245 [Tanacetum coccineum]|uniref:Uncharacterized protein n=1 Tax=Tanacetum coccineum TaxID=301880 RepID=A0ABQ4YV66_9ASTR